MYYKGLLTVAQVLVCLNIAVQRFNVLAVPLPVVACQHTALALPKHEWAGGW